MEMKKALTSARILLPGLSLSMLLAGSLFSTSVVANDFLCQASQASDKALPQLEQACPIGQGLWGKKVPQAGNHFFWIQCGLLPKPMPLPHAKPLYKQITTDVWMKPEPDGYRCLIGPYTEFAQAKTELNQVKRLARYKDAFIRVVDQDQAASGRAPAAKKKTAATRPDTEAFQPQAPKPVVPAAKPTPVATAKVSPDANIEVRLQAVVQGKTYVVPYQLDGGNQFYMEYGKAWNRFNYADSQALCRQLNMSLATTDEFKLLRDSGVMEKQHWPLQLPYWGHDRWGLFADREPNRLTGVSLLNVLCVR
ncbi:SPOR domain-containing protein [Vibrio sp. CAU 1672]|uniref:SPOR domain-containing protein n=1 Tax=Vibrio sp. CAU 1672 TaxID=3032594 RepID=UPI0023DAC2B2|nr:SPOR domain-containing protein [Vibrio sp. CAU 1672]MDF2154054.1 SPOR domain-containing protein [Vibrio sp. CAU 1672]